MKDSAHDRAFSSLLDGARWTAAWVVALGHVRNEVFPAYTAIVDPSPLLKAFFFVVSMGQSAVMVFFVLSGFLVGGALAKAPLSVDALVRYAAARFVRLYSVLVPAFALTAFLAAVRFVQSGGVDNAIFTPPFSLGTLLINLANLQNVWNRPYGDNFPLWSLTNECWYYIAFPIGLHAVRIRHRQPAVAALGLTAAAGLLIALSPSIAVYSLIWLLGVGAAVLPWRPGVALPLVALVVSLTVSRLRFSGGYFPIDLLTGLAFGAVLLAVQRETFAPRWLLRLARLNAVLAGFSFSLYVIHVPIIGLLKTRLRPWPLDPQTIDGLATYAACAIACLAVAYLFSLATERHVYPLRKRLVALLRPALSR